MSTYKWGYKLKLFWVVFAVAKNFSYFLSLPPILFKKKRERGHKFLKQHWDSIPHDPSPTFLYFTATYQDQVLRMPCGLWTVLKQFMITAFRIQHIISLTHPLETIRMKDFLVLFLSSQSTQMQSCMRWRPGSLGWRMSCGCAGSETSCPWLFSLWVLILSIVKCVLTSEQLEEFRFKCLWSKPLASLSPAL